MKRVLFTFLFIVSCMGGTLPSDPVISKYVGSSDAESLMLYWFSMEGADSFTVFGMDSSSLTRILTTKDTFAVIRNRYPYILVVAYAPYDIRQSDTLTTSPYSAEIKVYSYGSGSFSGVCFDEKTNEKIYPCNPESGNAQPYLMFVLDSLSLISPSKNSSQFGLRKTLFKRATGTFPSPTHGFVDNYKINPDDTVALWIDLGIEGEFDEQDYMGKVIVDSVHTGDLSRDSIYAILRVWHHRIPRLKWFF